MWEEEDWDQGEKQKNISTTEQLDFDSDSRTARPNDF